MLLLSLAFAVTIGSVMSPIGNPQNLLIAIHGNVTNPFVTFLRFLLVPTLFNLFLAYLLLRLFYRKHFSSQPLFHTQETIRDPKLAALSRISLILLVTNVIIIQNAEKRSGVTLTFFEFVRIGIPLTIVNVMVYWLFSSVT